MLLCTAAIVMFLKTSKVLHYTFSAKNTLTERLKILLPTLAATVLLAVSVSNEWADHSHNHYKNELSKAGIFSFFTALRSN